MPVGEPRTATGWRAELAGGLRPGRQAAFSTDRPPEPSSSDRGRLAAAKWTDLRHGSLGGITGGVFFLRGCRPPLHWQPANGCAFPQNIATRAFCNEGCFSGQ